MVCAHFVFSLLVSVQTAGMRRFGYWGRGSSTTVLQHQLYQLSLLLLILSQIHFIPGCFSQTLVESTVFSRQYSLNYRFAPHIGLIPQDHSVLLTCPLVSANVGDQVLFIRHIPGSNPVIVQTAQLSETINPDDYEFPVSQFALGSNYSCEIRRPANNRLQLVSRIQFKIQPNKGYKRFIYDSKKTVHVKAKIGQPLSVICPLAETNLTDLNSIAWFKLPGLKIEDLIGSELELNQVQFTDLGTYYCGLEKEVFSQSLPVQKVEIESENYVTETKFAVPLKHTTTVFYKCSNVPSELTPVTWEYPTGALIVGHYTNPISSAQIKGNQLETRVTCHHATDQKQKHLALSYDIPHYRSRRSSEIQPIILISSRPDPNELEITLTCSLQKPLKEEIPLIYRWKLNEVTSPTMGEHLITKLVVVQDSEVVPTTATCEVELQTTGEILRSSELSLVPNPITASASLEMKESYTRIYSFKSGESLELHCEVDKNYVQGGKDVSWTFNGGSLPGEAIRMDRLRTSIVVITGLTFKHEGYYECYQGEKKLKLHLIQMPIPLSLRVDPTSETHWANADETVEFHCRLDGRDDGNQLTDWYFIPEGGDREIPIPSGVRIERPDTTPSTSFLSIVNVRKYHEGIYVCRALNLKSQGILKVKARDLTVTPEEVQARAGTTVQFLCELSAIDGVTAGKVMWVRTDRRDLRPGKEEVIGSGGGRALLIVKRVDRSEYNTTYMCTDGYNKAYATLQVRDICPPGFKQCNTQECLEDVKFCNGIPECADGSDEIPSKCNECGANEFACGIVEGKQPDKRCYLQFWHCDGEDDCGNNFDEVNCPPPSEWDKCNGTHFQCPGIDKTIARAFLCDGMSDCEPGGEDEAECSSPSIIEPVGETQLIGHQSGNLTLTCIAYGRPPAAISWRFNWAGIKEEIKHVVNNTVVDCNMVISHLTLIDLDPRYSGLYTCEAVNRGRVLAPDFSITVAKSGVCRAPKFNDAAWFEDMCLDCYCSNVTSECTSAKGYRQSPQDKLFLFDEGKTAVRTYAGDTIEMREGKIEIDRHMLRVTDVSDQMTFVESDFGQSGSWVNSYGMKMKVNMRLFGQSQNYIAGPVVALHSPSRSIYYCPPSDRVFLYSVPVGYDNQVEVRLTEREPWFLDRDCKEPVNQNIGRAGFMQVLSNIQKVGIRVKSYRDQVGLELYNMQREHAIESNLPGQWVGEMEQCVCPPEYEGLSCEICAPGYEKDPEKPWQCRLVCACDQCDEEGRCITCPGNRAGPKCQQCKPGFYRPEKSSMSNDCIPCDKCERDTPHVVKDCITDPTAENDHFCKCQNTYSGKVLDPDCDICELSRAKGVPPPDDANCESKPEPISCHPAGTQSVEGTGECQCKSGYTGLSCSECSEGFFKYGRRCLNCFCAGQTSSCRLSDEHYFWNITMDDPAGFGFNIWLAQRTPTGGLERAEASADGKPRVERLASEIIVKNPLNTRGVIHFGIQLIPPEPESPTENDLPVYRQLYGGTMSFRMDSMTLDPKLVTQSEASVVVELESIKFGRVWTLATYNLDTQRYEVEFNEEWWPGGWRMGVPSPESKYGPLQGLNRGQLMRVLATTSSIAIVTSSGDSDSLKGMRLSGLSLQVARPVRTSGLRELAIQQGFPLAPVEICDCLDPAKPGERELSPSCEGCRDPKKKTVVRLEPFGEDLTCGGCEGEECGECSEGQYKYNLYTGEEYETCQTGLTMDSKERRVVVDLGKTLTLSCRATSYRGGMPTHEWQTPDNEGKSEAQIVRKALNKRGPTAAQNESAFRSEALLRIENTRLEDAGQYKCIVSGVGSKLEQNYYVVVRDPSETVVREAPEGDQLNRLFPLPIPPPTDLPEVTTYELSPHPVNKDITVIKGYVKNPSDLDAHHLIWQTSNGSKIEVIDQSLNSNTGQYEIQLAHPHEAFESGNETISGFLVGKDPIFTPYWNRLPEPQILPRDPETVTALDILDPPPEVSIPFMHSEQIRVRTLPGRTGIKVDWSRVADLPEQLLLEVEPRPMEKLPTGVTQDKTDLNIWAAAEQHEGIYEGIVYRESDGQELKRVQVAVRVEPMIPGSKTDLNKGEAADITDHKEVDEPDPSKPMPVWDFLVSGFTPDAQHCKYPSWILVDYKLNTTKDITNRVKRLSATNFRVDYPLSSGMYLRFQCRPVPESGLTGEIKFNISSPDPRIIFGPEYDNLNSTFPTRLICEDLNPERDSNLNISSTSMDPGHISNALTPMDPQPRIAGKPSPNRRIELDWRRIGDFDAFAHSGQFTCFVNNTETSGSRTIKIPSDKLPPNVILPKDPSERVYVYSPDAYLTPEVEGKYKIVVPEGEILQGQIRTISQDEKCDKIIAVSVKFRIFQVSWRETVDRRCTPAVDVKLICLYDSRPLEDFHGWKTEADELLPNLQLEKRGYSAYAKLSEADLSMNGRSLDCAFGQQKKTVEISVTPRTDKKVYAKIISDAFVGERLVATTGSDLNLTCDVKSDGRRVITVDRIDWFIQYASGIRRDARRTKLAESVSTSDKGEWIYFDRLTNKPAGAKIFCVVRPAEVQTAAQAYFPSPQVELWIREPKLNARILGEEEPGVIVGIETQTVQVQCLATDAWRNRTPDQVEYNWETKITSVQEEIGGSVELARPQPTAHDMPWLGSRTSQNYMTLAGLKRQPNWVVRLRCRAEEPISGASAYSQWVKLEVRPGDELTQLPRLRFVPHINPDVSPYPYKVDCIDDNDAHPSQVTWTRPDMLIEPSQIEQNPNMATIKWTHKGVDQFDPRSHAGLYTCTASNSYASTAKHVYLPVEVMPTESMSPETTSVRITSDVNEIFQSADDRYVRVIQGEPFELLCTYYGHPPPSRGLEWSIERSNQSDNSVSSHWISLQGLTVRSGRRYWTEIGAPRFDADGKHTGIFQCYALNEHGQIIKRDQVRVELHQVIVQINELSDSGLIEMPRDSNGTITCNAYDGYLRFILPEAQYTWEVETMNQRRVHPSLLASKVEMQDNQIVYHGLASAANDLKVRCVALNGTARYLSPYFGFRVFGEAPEPKRRTETEPGGTQWLSGDGGERVTLKIDGTNNVTGHLSVNEGDRVNLTCSAYDSVTYRKLTSDEYQFGWRLIGVHDEQVAFEQLSSGSVHMLVANDGSSGIFLIDNAKLSPNLPQPTARIQCLASKLTEAVTYYTKPVNIYVYPKDSPIDPVKENLNRESSDRIVAKVEGLNDRGLLSATAGADKTLRCLAIDRKTNNPSQENVQYAWEFSRLDGTAVDSNALVNAQRSGIVIDQNQITFQGLSQTSAVRGRCRVTAPRLVEDETEGDKGVDVFYSPFFRFDVIDEEGEGKRDFISPSKPVPQEEQTGIIVKVTGLDERGFLSGNVGEDATLICNLINETTGESVSETTDNLVISHGWEFTYLNGLPASSEDLAAKVEINPSSGQIYLSQLRAQPESEESNKRAFLRCVVKTVEKPSDTSKPEDVRTMHYAGPFIALNVPEKAEPIPDFVDVQRDRYELTVNGLNKMGILALRPGDSVTLDCVVRDTETDTLMDQLTSTQAVGWQIPVLPSGYQANAADMAKSIRSEGRRLIIEDVREDGIDGLRGRCWFSDSLTYYYSDYFPILVPRSTSDGRVRVVVDEIGTDDDRRYICAAYDSQTGARLTNVTYDWIFTTSTGEFISPAYYFGMIEKRHNQLTLQQFHKHLQLPENWRDRFPIRGRCLVLAHQYSEDPRQPHKINMYTSSPFLLINPDAKDPSQFLTRPGAFEKGKPFLVNIDGVVGGLVTVPLEGTVTLTCKSTGSNTDGLVYTWEVQQRDGSPVDTAALVSEAVLIEGPGGDRMTLVGVRSTAIGLRGRCIVTNGTKSEDPALDTGPLKPGEQIASPFFDFAVTSDDPKLIDFKGHKDFDVVDDKKDYEVIPSGIDDKGRLILPKGGNTTMQIKLKDVLTGQLTDVNQDPQISHIGLEARYKNGQSAPLSSLAESVIVHSKDGTIDLYGIKKQTKPPIEIRFIVVRNEPSTDPQSDKPQTVRYASEPITVMTLEEGELEPKVDPRAPDYLIFPVVDGLNRCGHLPVKPGQNITLICRPNDTRLNTDNLVFGWEVRHTYGQTLPRINLLAKSERQERNRLTLIDMISPSVPMIGRCTITETTDMCRSFTSNYFEIGTHGLGCEPSQPIVEPDETGAKPVPGVQYQVLIRITGLNEEGQVVAKPGDSVTLKCIALNATTKEPIPESAIGWSFMSDTDEPLQYGRLASRVETTQDQELNLIGLHENSNARGRCMVTLDKQVTLSSPYFVFHVPGDKVETTESVSPTHSDRRVRVEISGLSERNQISVTRVGDDTTLRCQAIVAATSAPLHPIHGVRYGWEWRYVDEDPVLTSSVAVVLDATGERLGLKGIKAPAGTRGQNVKGRCVVHVPDTLIDPTQAQGQVLVYGSDYFTIDVVKKPTTMDEQMIPLPGKDTDGIDVVVNGLESNGYLVGAEKESVGVVCEIRNRTTQQSLSTEGMRAKYNVLYGWEFADVTGRSIDSSLFADSVSTDSLGNLRLRGLVAPRRGNLPFKIRCVAIVSKYPETPDQKLGPARSYKSEYFGVDVTRLDGSTTTDTVRGEEKPDVAGNMILVKIDGLSPDGSLSAQPGEDVTLVCKALDSQTMAPADGLSYSWELRRPSGNVLNMGILTDNVIQDGAKLSLRSVKELQGMKALGRCVVHRGKQIYRSDYFRIRVAPTPKGQELEGDGRVLVSLKGIDPEAASVVMKPNTQTELQCIGYDANSGEPMHGLEYGWDYNFKPTNGPEIEGSLGSWVELIEEKPGGLLLIRSTDKGQFSGEAKLRCRVFKDNLTYTSPYHLFVIDELEVPTKLPVTYPRYRVAIEGLSGPNVLGKTTGEAANLKCIGLDAKTGKPVDNLKYRWNLRKLDGEAVNSAELASDSLKVSGNELTITDLTTIPGIVKGRCEVSDSETGVWDASPYFKFEVRPREGEERPPIIPDEKDKASVDEVIRPYGPKEANASDDRITVQVSGLGDDGNLLGTTGSDRTLKCNAEVKDGVSAQINSYGWEFVDETGAPIPISNLADEFTAFSSTGEVQLQNLRQPQEGSFKGRCIVQADVTETVIHPDGSTETTTDQLNYPSKYFGISVTPDGSSTFTPGGLDVQGNKFGVFVHGLDTNGVLRGETGDIVTLRCHALDPETDVVLPDGVYSWELRDRLGRTVALENVAQQVIRSANVMSLLHLRPTDTLPIDEKLFGRCVVFSPSTKHIYKSPSFYIDVRKPSMSGMSGPDSNVAVTVTGVSADGVFVAKEGESASLECQARDIKTGEIIKSDRASYHFQFEEAQPDRPDTYGGHIADTVTQEELPDGGIRLNMEGVRAGKWLRGRCVTTVLSKGPEEETMEHVLRYTSDYFWSGVSKPDQPSPTKDELVKRPSTISDFTHDPTILVKVHGVNPNDTIIVEPGSDVELACYAIDVSTGAPLKNLRYLWELRTFDNNPVPSNRLAKELESDSSNINNGQKLKIKGYHASGEGVRVRCLATGTDTVQDPRLVGRTFASPIYTFQTLEPVQPEEPVGERTRYDPETLHVEVSGLNPDGTLTSKEGDDVTLRCDVTDTTSGIPREGDFNIGWVTATGPDERPIPLNELADSVTIRDNQIIFRGLRKTVPKSGGIRSHCVVKLGAQDLIDPDKYANRTVALKSDVFVIYVNPKSPMEEDARPKTVEEELPYTKWVPGKDPREAVIVKVYPLGHDGSTKLRPGDDLDLSCIAVDAVTLRRILPSDQMTPIFSWELRAGEGGQLLPYTQVATGPITIKQPEPDATTSDKQGVSHISLQSVRKAPDSPVDVSGRCVVQLGKQLFSSPYFHIKLESPGEISTHTSVPKDYWNDDGEVEVLVNGLDPDGHKRVTEGSDIRLNCKAQDAKTKQPIPSDRVTIGWQVIEPEDQIHITPWMTNGIVSGSQLEIQEIELPEGEGTRWDLWAWCIADVRDEGIIDTGPDSIKHYRSQPFKLMVTAKDRIPDEKEGISKLHGDVYVKVSGLADDGKFTIPEGGQGELSCQAIDTRTTKEYAKHKVIYGWEWRYLDGTPAYSHQLGEVVQSTDKLAVQNAKYSVPLKGRCIATILPVANFGDQVADSIDSPVVFASDFFFVSVSPVGEPDDNKRSLNYQPVDATDGAIILEVNPVDDEGRISINTGGASELSLVAKDAMTNAPLDENTETKLLGYTYEISYLTGQPAHLGELGEDTKFDSKSGKLSTQKAHFSTKPLKIRFAAVVQPKPEEGAGEEAAQIELPKKYWSPYYPINIIPTEGSSKPEWIDRAIPIYDLPGDAMKVYIEGLDAKGNAAARPGNDMKLTCRISDKLDLPMELEPNGYSWQFVDRFGRPANPGRLAEKVELREGKELSLTNYRKSAVLDGIRGRCLIRISVPTPVDVPLAEDTPPTQNYASPYFAFTLSREGTVIEETQVTEPTFEEKPTTTIEPATVVTEGSEFFLKIDSPTNMVYSLGQSRQTVLARTQRPFELNCKAYNLDGSLYDGEQQLRLVWYYRQPEIPGDVPIPSQLLPVSPPRMETLTIKPQTDSTITIASDAYSFRDDEAEFHCRAYLASEEHVTAEVVFIQSVKEMFDVQIFDEESRSRVYAFAETVKTLTCYVNDRSNGERVEPASYQWEIAKSDGEWVRDSNARLIAQSIDGWRTNQLQLIGLRFPETTLADEVKYEFRCIAAYNSSFDTISRPFVMNVRKKPEIQSIRIDRVKPDEAVLDLHGVPEELYDATKDYQLGCRPEVTGGEAFAVWQKCEDAQCLSVKDIIPSGDNLFLFANSTRYQDEGRFRCQVSLQLKEYNFNLVKNREVVIKRKAAPAIYSSDAMTYTINDEMSLQCTDESSSPESTVRWTFEPSGGVPPERRDPILLGKTYAYGRIYIFAIARGQLMPEHSGKYTCTATNPFGTASSSIAVTVTEEVHRGQYRFLRAYV